MDPRRTKASSTAKKPTAKKVAPKTSPKVTKDPADFKSLEEALKAKVPADAAADHFKVGRRDAQLIRLDLGLIKPGPMNDYWTRVKVNRDTKRPEGA